MRIRSNLHHLSQPGSGRARAGPLCQPSRAAAASPRPAAARPDSNTRTPGWSDPRRGRPGALLRWRERPPSAFWLDPRRRWRITRPWTCGPQRATPSLKATKMSARWLHQDSCDHPSPQLLLLRGGLKSLHAGFSGRSHLLAPASGVVGTAGATHLLAGAGRAFLLLISGAELQPAAPSIKHKLTARPCTALTPPCSSRRPPACVSWLLGRCG